MIYRLSGEFRYLAILLRNVNSKANTRLWWSTNDQSAIIGNTTAGSKGIGYAILKSDDFVKVAYSSTGTWTNPMNAGMAVKENNGNIKSVSISLGISPGDGPLLAGTKIKVYGIKA